MAGEYPSDAAVMLAAGKAQAGPQIHGEGVPFIVLPPSYELEGIEHLLPQPKRKRGKAAFNDIDSFVRFVKEQKTGTTRIFASISETAIAFSAVLDFHGGAEAHWCEYCAHYQCSDTPEWRKLLALNCKPQTQAGFAYFLEEHQLSIYEPDGATLLELVTTLEGKKDVRFSSQQRLQSGGVKLLYEEDIVLRGSAQTGTQQGAMEIPQSLTFNVEPFIGTEPVEIVARLRYRIENRTVAFTYELINPHEVIKTVAAIFLARIKADLQLEPFFGSYQRAS